jgi:hypothetical protein
MQNSASQTFEKARRTLRETGYISEVAAKHEQWWHGLDDVLAVVQWSQSTRICRISRTSCVAQTLVWRILHHGSFYLYCLHRVQHILLLDYANCVQFYEWLQPQPHILCDVLFTDKGQCTRGVITSTWNSHSWAHENPYEVAVFHFQHSFSVNALCGGLGNNHIRPHVIQGYLTALYYRNFLEN